jgi:uncharacterized membrane protein YedE/YeeE
MNPDWLYGLAGGLMIGTSAGLLLLLNGRIAGISGILGAFLSGHGFAEGGAFLVGMIGLAALYTALTGGPAVIVTGSVPLLVAGGLMAGLGTRLGGGCTAGHGICGIARLSPRSMAATVTFMVAAGIVVFAARHLIGGA